MHVKPTAIYRRRERVTKGSKLAPSGRPPKLVLLMMIQVFRQSEKDLNM